MASSSQTGNLGGTQNPPVDPPSGSDSDSDSDTSMSSSGSAGIFNSSTIWSWLVKRTEIDDLSEPEPLSVALKRPANNAKKVRKGQGEWEYIEYFPEWTDPEYNPDYEVWHDSDQMRKRFKRDITQVLRPALLLQDQMKNPTMHALRWGMHPDGTAGRSWVTPTVAIGTTVEMPGEGLKSASDFLKSTVVDDAHPQGMSLRDYLETQANARDNLSAEEKGQAWLKLYDVISENQDYQRYLFDGFTTDDFVERKAYDPANLVVPDSNLQGPLHPLVARNKWLKTDHLGGAETSPRQLFNINGYRGEYTAWDDIIWAALQPTLQMVTRILNSNHPYWQALLNLYARCPVHYARDLRDPHEKTRVPIRDNLRLAVDPAFMWDETRRLRDLNFPSMEVTSKVLLNKIEWEFGSVYRITGQDKVSTGSYGSTTFEKPGDPPIRIQIGLELLFPLLVRSYTLGEKAVCSFLVAATMLHELAHAAHYAHAAQFQKDKVWVGIDSQFGNFSQEVFQNLESLGDKLLDRSGKNDECFFENEEQAEMGFAFENRLFGGVLETLPLVRFKGLHWQTVAGIKSRWPQAAPNPHPSELQGSADFLNYPSAHAMTMEEVLPVELCARFFSNEFWSCDAVKYGWQSFKFSPQQPNLARAYSQFPSYVEKGALYGSQNVADWIAIANVSLREAGHNVIADYLKALSWEGLDETSTKRVWTFEQLTWDETDTQFNHLVKAVQRDGPEINSRLAFLRTSQVVINNQFEQERQQWRAAQASGQDVGNGEPTMDSFIEQRMWELFQYFALLYQDIGEIHRCLTAEITYLQNLIYDYLRGRPHSRLAIWNAFGGRLAGRMSAVHMKLTTGCIGILSPLEQHVTDLLHFNSPWPRRIIEELQKLRGLFQMDQNHILHALEFLDPKYIHADITLPAFVGVMSSRKKKKSEVLRNMAIREMALITEPVLKEVIEMWYRIIQKRDEFNSDTAGFEAKELKNDVEKSIKKLKTVLKSQGKSLKKIINQDEHGPTKLGTNIFDVSKILKDAKKEGKAQTQAPATGQQPQPETEQPPKRVKFSEFPRTPTPSQWNQRATVPFSTQAGFGQFSGLPGGFNAGAPQQGLFTSTNQAWQPSQPIGGNTPAMFAPFPHPYATRETTTEDVQLERDAQLFADVMFGGQALQNQFQHGVPVTYQTYREEQQRAASKSPEPSPERFPHPV